jgi:sialate O-acetylesterase
MAAHLLAALALLHLHSGSATVTVPGIFSDGMVLQEHATYDQRPFIYGLAEAVGELVTVIRHRPAANANDTYLATADASKQWIVQLDPDYFSSQNNNLTIFITGSAAPVNTITIRNVVYGDVFLCSGQSNSAIAMRACRSSSPRARSLPTLPPTRAQ